jgi:hypothetical protein
MFAGGKTLVDTMAIASNLLGMGVPAFFQGPVTVEELRMNAKDINGFEGGFCKSRDGLVLIEVRVFSPTHIITKKYMKSNPVKTEQFNSEQEAEQYLSAQSL